MTEEKKTNEHAVALSAIGAIVLELDSPEEAGEKVKELFNKLQFTGDISIVDVVSMEELLEDGEPEPIINGEKKIITLN